MSIEKTAMDVNRLKLKRFAGYVIYFLVHLKGIEVKQAWCDERIKRLTVTQFRVNCLSITMSYFKEQ